MKLKRLFFLFIVTALFTGCASNNRKFSIVGNIAAMPKQTVVLEQWNANDMIAIVDSTHSDADGHFELSGVAPEMGLYRLDFKGSLPAKFILLSLVNGDIKIDGNWDKLEDYTVTGSPSSDDLKSLLGKIRNFTHDNMTMSIVLDTLKAQGKDSILTVAKNDLDDRRQHFTQDLEHYADTCSYEPNAIFAVRMLSISSEKYFLDAFTQSLNRRFPGARMTKDFAEWYGRAIDRQKQVAKPVEQGAIAPDITVPDINGKTVTLSSLKGSYVLLDFWASWCQPCRKENPNIVAAYQKFKDKNFTVLSVSLDNQKSAWQHAVNEDSLSWAQVSDLGGWNSPVAATYGVHAIPANFLIDPTGKIIARNLRGSDLLNFLQQELNKQPEPRQSP